MRLLDLFCGAGGAAMGYHRAGFEVVGVDIEPQPHYPFEFHQAGAWKYLDDYDHSGVSWVSWDFDAIHASPPCQAFTAYRRRGAGVGDRAADSRRTVEVGVWRIPLEVQQQAMGIDWMTLAELSEAIPPAYAEHIGEFLMLEINARQEAA